jgi:hypothetical protein
VTNYIVCKTRWKLHPKWKWAVYYNHGYPSDSFWLVPGQRLDMTKLHDLAQYHDGFVLVPYCKRCSAEGEKLLEDCPQKVILTQNISEKPLDEKKQNS